MSTRGGGEITPAAGPSSSSSPGGGGGGARVVYSFVGKGPTVALAEHPPSSSKAAGAYPRAAAQIRSKLDKDGKFQFSLDADRVAFANVHRGVCFGAIAEGGPRARQSVVLGMLSDATDAFFQDFSPESADPARCKGFSRTLARLADKANASLGSGLSKIESVRGQVEDVKTVMIDNVDKVLQRGEKLDDILIKSETMKDSAMQFRNQGKRLRRTMWVANLKVKLLVCAVVIAIALIVFFSVCRGVSCLN